MDWSIGLVLKQGQQEMAELVVSQECLLYFNCLCHFFISVELHRVIDLEDAINQEICKANEKILSLKLGGRNYKI